MLFALSSKALVSESGLPHPVLPRSKDNASTVIFLVNDIEQQTARLTTFTSTDQDVFETFVPRDANRALLNDLFCSLLTCLLYWNYAGRISSMYRLTASLSLLALATLLYKAHICPLSWVHVDFATEFISNSIG